jgi:hypothetical protein
MSVSAGLPAETDAPEQKTLFFVHLFSALRAG